MKKFKAIVRDRQTKEIVIIESEYKTKTDFVRDLRQNGFIVDPGKVKTSEIFDYIMENTNGNVWDWKNN